MGNLVVVAYGIHEGLAGDLNGGDESEGGDLEPPYVLEPDLGKRQGKYLGLKTKELNPPPPRLKGEVHLPDIGQHPPLGAFG
ncbi:hypothetical protein IFM89_009953 [Coptis chinensis]|uniref:Uncharacterized protein n=1 Tax=Coptis chinensis TaxID=261450 RepID=A0A835LR77_9MAGN|nr:hypothetical protein IFM89_009953 [Coptis chinensis]